MHGTFLHQPIGWIQAGRCWLNHNHQPAGWDMIGQRGPLANDSLPFYSLLPPHAWLRTIPNMWWIRKTKLHSSVLIHSSKTAFEKFIFADRLMFRIQKEKKDIISLVIHQNANQKALIIRFSNKKMGFELRVLKIFFSRLASITAPSSLKKLYY